MATRLTNWRTLKTSDVTDARVVAPVYCFALIYCAVSQQAPRGVKITRTAGFHPTRIVGSVNDGHETVVTHCHPVFQRCLPTADLSRSSPRQLHNGVTKGEEAKWGQLRNRQRGAKQLLNPKCYD